MGNRSSYPGNYQHRQGSSDPPPPPPPPPHGTSASRAVHPTEQTVCPQCQRILLIPPGAPLFRCPCGVLFRTETLRRVPHPPPVTSVQQAVMCRRCRRLSLVSGGEAGGIILCRCGAPALPINDLVMSLLAEGELGLLQHRGHRDECQGASHDLIEMLPTSKFCAATARSSGVAALGSVVAETEVEKAGGKHGDDVSCRVCFDDYVDGEELRVLPCFHRFHKSCIDEWLARKKLCPLCNTSVEIIMNSDFS